MNKKSCVFDFGQAAKHGAKNVNSTFDNHHYSITQRKKKMLSLDSFTEVLKIVWK